MTLDIDVEKARAVAPILYHAFLNEGIHGMKDMPEDRPPEGVATGSLGHVLFLTLTVSIDYQRDAHALWDSARRTYEDPETRYLFDPAALKDVPFSKMITDMQRHGLSKKMRNDTFIWRTVALTFLKKWDGDPRKFLAACDWNALTILRRLREDQHFDGQRMTWDFPFLRGAKIGPLWVRMLRDNGKVEGITNLENVPIPVDVHIARSTLALGIVKGTYHGSVEGVYSFIRDAWKQGVLGISTGQRPMIALDVDESLWHLSKYGCTKRDAVTGECPVREGCLMREYCVKGRIQMGKDGIMLETKKLAEKDLDDNSVKLSTTPPLNWIATVTLESDTYKYPDNDAGKNARKNADRMEALRRITQSLAGRFHSQGIVLFPGGYFHSGTDEVERFIPSIVEQIQQVLQGIYAEASSSIVICLGIDGKVLLDEGPQNRYDANQVSLAISKDGLIAYGKKFYPTDEIEAQVVDLATDYLSPAWLGNTQYPRIFTHGGRSFYLAECNDIKGLRNYPKPEPVHCVLNCVHGCYNRDDGPTCSYFVRLNFAGTSMSWKCPVFGSVVFFKREIAEKWRTGMFYRMWDRDPIQCDTDDNALAPIQTDSSFKLDEGLAQVDVYNLDNVFSQNPEYRQKSRSIHQNGTEKKSISKEERKTLPPSQALNTYTQIRNELDGLLPGSVIDQPTKFTYRGRNTLGYPKKTELDMISLSKPSSSNTRAVKFRIYPYVLAGHLNVRNPDEMLCHLPPGSVLKHERENPHPAEVFIEGGFSNETETEKFVSFLRSIRSDT